MDKINIEGTAKTPTLRFEPKQGQIEIKGRSIPEDAVEFYSPLVNGIKEYLSTPTAPLQIDIALEYLNTASTKCLLDMLKLAIDIKKQDPSLSVNWFYEEDDESMRDVGEDLQSLSGLTFKMCPVEV